jgi:S-formylglutathione hydrolase
VTSGLETLSRHGCFGGIQSFHRHNSREIGLPMRFSVYLPPQAERGRVPAAIYLAGLTCTEETFMVKAGAQRLAAHFGLALVTPDTSPRGADVAGESEAWDFGVGAGFYLDAVRAPWAVNWRMESYIVRELLPLLTELPIDCDRIGIFGHSMGGHGALTLGLRHPGVFKSLSAFAPICAPAQCPWGRKAFSGYLGDDPVRWNDHDACELMRRSTVPPYPAGILIDQGLDDQFLREQLHPDLFDAACATVGQPLTLRRQPGYDHGYYFVESFVADHIEHHALRLNGAVARADTASM